MYDKIHYNKKKKNRVVSWELQDVQTGFRKGRRTRNQIASIFLIIEKPREFMSVYGKNHYNIVK